MIYVDLETTADGGPKGDSPEAHWQTNRVLLYGWMEPNGDPQVSASIEPLILAMEAEYERVGRVTIVAHNAKFDLKYLMRDAPDFPWQYVNVWDTMTWEYLNSGHRWTFPSLEDVAQKRGITFSKTLDLGALLAAGTKMQDIDCDTLADYLEGDVKVLAEIQQKQEAIKTIWMDYILPLAEMELNGLPFNVAEAEKLALKLCKEISDTEQWLREHIIDNCEWQDGSAVTLDDFSDQVFPKTKCIKPTANRMISHLLSNAPKEVKITQKWRLSLKGQPLLTLKEINTIYEDIDPTHVGFPVDEDTLDTITKYTDGELISNLIKHRKAYKIVNTYLMPMIEQARIQGTVHPKLNTAVTSTGRLSSSAPNGQNMPPVVRKLIYAAQGRALEEVDFSQLEMVGAACLSGDKQMQYDLNHAVDIHYNTASSVFGLDQAEEKRKLAKNVNFGVLYGGKAYGLSKQTGVDKNTIQKLINAFYTRYPGVAKWQRSLFEEVVDNMEVHDNKYGVQRYRSDYILPASGRKFRFIENEAPGWVRKKTGRPWSFSPNHTANYPIQGFAGGDIVMYGLWNLWIQIQTYHNPQCGRALFRMTVHDSILIDKEVYHTFNSYYDIMISAIQKRFNLPVGLHVDVETGFTWS